jgi:glucose-1-phosphate adenylyltransferase
MGVYVFRYPALQELLRADAREDRSAHDIGKNLIPAALRRCRVSGFKFTRGPSGQQSPYWRDVGTLESYWRGHMELLDPAIGFELNDPSWPIRTYHAQLPPPRFAAGDGEYASVQQSIVAAGCRLGASAVRRSVLSSQVQVGSSSLIEDSVVLPGARIGDRCWLRRVIVDAGCELPSGTVIGDTYEQPSDTSESGVLLVTSALLARECTSKPLPRRLAG